MNNECFNEIAMESESRTSPCCVLISRSEGPCNVKQVRGVMPQLKRITFQTRDQVGFLIGNRVPCPVAEMVELSRSHLSPDIEQA